MSLEFGDCVGDDPLSVRLFERLALLVESKSLLVMVRGL